MRKPGSEKIMAKIITERVYCCWCERFRTVNVSLPENYDAESGKRWRVIYMLDGESAFLEKAEKPEWSFCVEKAIDEITAEGKYETEELADGAIVVAVQSANEYEDLWQRYKYPRDNEYSFANDDWQGWGEEFARWMVRELKPYLEQKYSMAREREHNAVWGSSLSGTFALWCVLKYPHVFSKAAAFSPGVSFDDGPDMASYEKQFATIETVAMPLRLYLDVGTNENVPGGGTSNEKYLTDVENFYKDYLCNLLMADSEGDVCIAHGELLDVQFKIFEGAQHTTEDWQKRLPDVFRYCWE